MLSALPLRLRSKTAYPAPAQPGTGLLAIDAVRARDYQVVQAVVIVFATIFILTNLLVDILYAYLDPRIRYR